MAFRHLVEKSEVALLKLPAAEVDELVSSLCRMVKAGRRLMDAPESVAEPVGNMLKRAVALMFNPLRPRTLDDVIELTVKYAPTVGQMIEAKLAAPASTKKLAPTLGESKVEAGFYKVTPDRDGGGKAS